MIANVTDIEDKILAKSAERHVPWWAHAYEFERELHWAYDVLGCRPPTYEPRATGHIPEMLEMIAELIERGHAYVAPDGSGDVYFDVKSWPSYGELSNQRIDDMEAGRGRRPPRQAGPAGLRAVEGPHRGHAADGVLADAVGPRPAGLAPGVLGDGRASTSATSSTSTAAAWTCASRTTRTSWPSRRRSGRSSPASGCTTRSSPRPARRCRSRSATARSCATWSSGSGRSSCGTTWCSRTTGRWSSSPSARWRRPRRASSGSRGSSTRATEVTGGVEPAAELPADFVAAMDDDLGTPAAVAVLHNTVRDGNKLVADGDSPALTGEAGRRARRCSACSGWTRWPSRGCPGPAAE